MAGIVNDLQVVWLFFLTLTREAPLWFWTPPVGMGIAWGLTSLFKRALAELWPRKLTLDMALAKRRAARRDFLVETVAVAAGGVVTYLLMGKGGNAALVAFATAVLTPFGWKAAVVVFGPIVAWWGRSWARRASGAGR
jgi:hypothetical protein